MKPRLSIHTIAPLLQDRTDAQSPIKLDNTELSTTVVPSLNGVVFPTTDEDAGTKDVLNVLVLAATSSNTLPEQGKVEPKSNASTTDAPPSFVTQVTQGAAPTNHLDIAAAKNRVCTYLYSYISCCSSSSCTHGNRSQIYVHSRSPQTIP